MKKGLEGHEITIKKNSPSNLTMQALIVLLLSLIWCSFETKDAAAGTTTVFGPHKYVRTTGKPNVYTSTFSASARKGNIVIFNGKQEGKNRISSAVITVNGIKVVTPSDFNTNVYLLEKPIDLKENNSLRVELGSAPGSYLSIEITVSSSNTAPTADAGPDQDVTVGDLVTLDGRASFDPDGNLITYHWAIGSAPAGSNAAMGNPDSVMPTFVPDLPGDYFARLTVNDGQLDSLPDEVLVIASLPNVPPTANAGPDQSVITGSTVFLNGAGSFDPDGDPLTYRWEILAMPAGSGAAFDNASSLAPSFTADRDGQYVVGLIVNDGRIDSLPDDVVVISSAPNAPPIAYAGADQIVSRNALIQLDGTGSSDPNNDPLTYNWSIVSQPGGSTAQFDDPNSPSPTVPADKEGEFVFRLVVDDGRLDSAPDTVVVTVVNNPPAANAGPDRNVAPGVLVILDGSGSSDSNGDLLAYSWALLSIPAGSTSTLTSPASVHPSFTPDIPGNYLIGLTVSDGAATSSPDTVAVSVSVPFVVVPDVVGMVQANAEAAIVAAGLTVDAVTTANSDTVAAGSVISQSPVAGSSVSSGSAVSLVISLGPSVGGLPPDPSTIAPPAASTVATTIGRSTEFLYTGTNPIQTGVAPGVIDPKRAAVIRGTVLTRDNQPLPGVTVSILNRPEFGQTLSRADGMFDLAINGGGILTVNYQKAGHLPAQRQVDVPWQDYAFAPDVVMIVLDSAVTVVDLSSSTEIQIARGSTVTDADGTRRATLFFPPGLSARMTLADGSSAPLSTLSVRATEYTVGPNGPLAMPGLLPPMSAYTYAVELSVDEALAAGATTVSFDQPVPTYLENFLNFPTGTVVPSGYYDRGLGQWVPMPNGKVIKITNITAGLADIDVTGDGVADTGAELAALGVTDAERGRLAGLYAPGASLWRVPVTHFSPWDSNWPINPPPLPPGEPPRSGEDDEEQCEVPGSSIVACPSQVLGENVAVLGSPYTLVYRSDRIPGRVASRMATIPLLGASVPAGLIGLELRLEIAGRVFTESFPPNPNQQFTFTWDGLDAFGRQLVGLQPLTVYVRYVYDVDYVAAARTGAAFGQPGGAVLPSNGARQKASLSRQFTTLLGSVGLGQSIGGWSLDVHHAYDPVAKRLRRGDGRRVDTAALGSVMTTFAGNGIYESGGDGGPAVEASFGRIDGIAVAPDGTVYVTDLSSHGVRRIGPDGIIDLFVGPATGVDLSNPQGLALGPDGSLYIADRARVLRVAPDGVITTVAGTGMDGYNGDGIPATQALLHSIVGVDVAPDGTIYIADGVNHRVRRVGLDGIITTLAGTGTGTFNGDGIPANQANLGFPNDVAVGPDGAVYIADLNHNRIRRVGVNGIISTVAGTGVGGYNGDGIPAVSAQLFNAWGLTVGPDGRVYVADERNRRIRRIETDGTISTVAGTGICCPYSGEGIPATQGNVASGLDVALGPDGSLYITDNSDSRIRRIAPALPGLSGNEIGIASDIGREFYVFDASGRHLRTLNSLTSAALREFTYDGAGRLASIVEKTGGSDKVTTIVRDSSGIPIRIVAPFGQETALTTDANGYLAGIANPAGETVQITSSSTGLLETFTNPRGKISRYVYDGLGRLVQATDPAGGTQTFTRTALDTGYRVTRTTALGHTTSYRVERLPNGNRRLTNTKPAGQLTTLVFQSDGTIVLTQPHGSVTTSVLGPDPRFGMQSSVDRSFGVALPDGTAYGTTTTENAVLSDPTDPFSLSTLTATSLVNGRSWTTTYTAASRTYSAATPTGRTTTGVIDAQGRLVFTQPTGLAATSFTYDALGRLEALVKGSGAEARTTTLAYGPQGFLASVTDSIGRITRFAHDQAGRVTAKTLADGGTVGFDHDAAGNLVRFTAPNGMTYTFEYSDKGRLALVSPPSVSGTGATAYSFNLAGQLTDVSLPDSQVVRFGYDSNGRLVTRTLSTNGSVTASDLLTYDPQGRVATITAAGGVTTTYGYLGAFLRDEAWTGPVSGSVTRTYDANLWRTGQSVNGTDQIDFTYDNDGLLTGAGDLVLVRDAQTGLPVGSSLGLVESSSTHSAFGELTSFVARVSGNPVFSLGLTRDKAARVVQRTETIAGATRTLAYEYDSLGQLLRVTADGVETERYVYDANGNRTTATVGEQSVTAVYDGEDRLMNYGATVYTYNGAGNLVSRSSAGQTTTYQYDSLGNLLGVSLPDGRILRYVVDGLGRRVGKRVNGVLTKGFLYSGKRLPIAELDGSNAVLSRFVFTGRGAPAYMIRGGTAYRYITDEAGSVRLVVNAQTGAVAQRLDYDSFGNVTQDTNPGFQPFGFAGGLYDADTGLVRFGRRDYDANTGRWTAKEPSWVFRGETNLYRYAHNNPVNRVDRNGLQDDPIPQLPSESDYCRCGGPGTTAQCLPASGQAGEWIDRFENNLEGTEPGNPGAAFNFACVVRDVADAVFFGDTERAWQQGMCRVGGNEGECFEDDEQSLGEPAPPPPPETQRRRGRSSQPPLPECLDYIRASDLEIGDIM